jgi:anti-sigma B factor antagonist
MGVTMSDSELQFRLQVVDGPDAAVATFQLKDQFLNYAFSDQLKAALRDLTADRIGKGVRSFVVDLTAVNVMDSCGLSVLIGMRKLVEQVQGRMIVIAPSPIILRLFAITRLDRVFEIVGNEADARAALAKSA